MKKYFIPLIILLTVLVNACNERPLADRIYINAVIWTGDSSNLKATSLAVKDSVILFVGNEYQKYKGKNTEIIDLKGKIIIPGFIDNHTHFLSGGYQLASLNLRNVTSQEGFIDVVRNFIQPLSDKRWVLGGDWDHEGWGGVLPSKEWIDSVSMGHPLFCNRYDGHMALANSAALKLAGIDKNTPDPPGGEIVKDAVTGEPTGILKDEAMNLVSKIVPELTYKELAECLQRAQQEAFAHGVTQIHDMGSYGGWLDLQTYQTAYNNNQLDLRIYSFVPISTWARLDSFVKQNGWGNNTIRWGGLKGFVDGSLGSTTAWFYKPYLDAPNTNGLQVTDTDLLRKWILQADSAGLHIAVHAIGDHANDWLLKIYAEAESRNGEKDRRFRIEHAQHLTQQAIPLFARLNVIASMQPHSIMEDGKWAYKRIDTARLKGTYAFNSILKTNAILTFGSDWTVEPLDPIGGIYAAVTRRTSDNKNQEGWFPSEKISVEQALRCYTANNAFAGFQEKLVGMLKADMLADFVVLSDNILTVSTDRIMDIKVLETTVNGKRVYLSK